MTESTKKHSKPRLAPERIRSKPRSAQEKIKVYGKSEPRLAPDLKLTRLQVVGGDLDFCIIAARAAWMILWRRVKVNSSRISNRISVNVAIFSW